MVRKDMSHDYESPEYDLKHDKHFFLAQRMRSDTIDEAQKNLTPLSITNAIDTQTIFANSGTNAARFIKTSFILFSESIFVLGASMWSSGNLFLNQS